ncbi:MAG: prolyl aminopeptidase [Deltaproteobacteria bacterium]|nr:prolyl aminopeptidase [Deltaproteobacteria bacterium]
MTWLHPPVEPFDTGRLQVSPLHTIYYEQVGRLDGKPAIFLHGGPGGGISPAHRRFFAPDRYRAVLFDQRGSGKSTPHACLDENTTWDLVADIERLREHLGIERWLVFGGSWGSTLALAYAQAYPERVTELVLRGIFLGRPVEIDWLYQGGTVAALFPDGWERFVAPVPVAERGDMLRAYKRLLTSGDPAVRLDAARAWSVWETLLSHIVASPEDLAEAELADDAIAITEIEIHYFLNSCFLRSPTQLLEDIDLIRHIPTVIVQGRYDLVCPPMSAFELAKAFPEADFQVIGDAGHSAFEAPISRALVAATDRLGERR